eukprot:4629272-Amphidinium_carterae.1
MARLMVIHATSRFGSKANVPIRFLVVNWTRGSYFFPILILLSSSFKGYRGSRYTQIGWSSSLLMRPNLQHFLSKNSSPEVPSW